MADLKDVVQKALYLGVGFAAYASEKASRKLLEFQAQAQKLADEMVSRGAMSAEEARRWVEDLTHQASTPPSSNTSPTSSEPRRIEILIEDDDSGKANAEEVEKLRQQMLKLQAELHRLQEK
jgi:polyhydroxyalkanoate synthesis regulator phasin